MHIDLIYQHLNNWYIGNVTLAFSAIRFVHTLTNARCDLYNKSTHGSGAFLFKEANGFVIVSPEYNATIPPALTNLLDYFPPAVCYRHKPVSIVTYCMGE